MVTHLPPPEIGTLMERRIRQAIIDTVDEQAPGWKYIPFEERQKISDILLRLSKDLRKKRFLADKAVIQ